MVTAAVASISSAPFDAVMLAATFAGVAIDRAARPSRFLDVL